MKATAIIRRYLTGPGALARLAGAAMLVSTVANQHPNIAFNRLQRKDTFSLLPNWRFFAPTPATYDYHILYRTCDQEGKTSSWKAVDLIAGRRFRQIVWFPTRRQEKAVFDLTSELLRSSQKGFQFVISLPAYRILCAYLRKMITEQGITGVEGFQFTFIRAAGYDESEEPEPFFISPYIPITGPRGEDPVRQREEASK